MNYKLLNLAVKNEFVHMGKKMKANPYFGCQHQCLFCPANDGFLKKKVFDDYRNNGTIFVVDNIVQHVEKYILNMGKNVSVHLSPVADPFQPIENKVGKSREIIEYCFNKKIPLGICTKAVIPDDIIERMGKHKESFVQLSMITEDEKKRSFIVKGGGATVNEMFKQIEKLMYNKVNTIIRVDPIFPYITDDMDEFNSFIKKLANMGITTILSSCADLTNDVLDREGPYLETYEKGLFEKYKELYTEDIHGRQHARLAYRKSLFEKMKNICMNYGVGFGITWEPDLDGKSLSSLYSYGAERFEKQLIRVVT
jgi:DNA repair photolyase